ncbi:hypothetical protein PUN28_001725 [Cardiocondyla obscurior]|uniref:Uncharacterized protein n=1 Tax=Cardiocondyla obscurior TaxID=286306 RepID=A0AAW2GQY6_9HYME
MRFPRENTEELMSHLNQLSRDGGSKLTTSRITRFPQPVSKSSASRTADLNGVTDTLIFLMSSDAVVRNSRSFLIDDPHSIAVHSNHRKKKKNAWNILSILCETKIQKNITFESTSRVLTVKRYKPRHGCSRAEIKTFSSFRADRPRCAQLRVCMLSALVKSFPRESYGVLTHINGSASRE